MSAEIPQKTGSDAQIIFAREAAWGSPPVAADGVYMALPIVGGESLDDNITTFRSDQIRNDRTRNRTVRGTQKPGGGLPLELAATGPVLSLLQACLGGAVTTTANGSAVSAVQTITISGTPTGGSFRLGFKDEFTAPIAYNAAGSAIDAALEALSTVGTGGVAVTGSSPTYTATFTSAAGNVPNLVVDDGLLTGGTYPTVNVATTTYGVSAAQYVHTFIGTTSSTLPSFTIEKGFTDPPPAEYQAMYGNRVGQFSIQIGVDAIVKVATDIMSKQAQGFTTTSIANTFVVTPTPLNKPFTSVQVELFKDTTLAGIISTLSLSINNNMNGDAGFFLGSNLRKSLKASARDVTGSATAAFTDAVFYNLAKSGQLFGMKIRCRDDDGNQILFIMPVVQSLPNGSSPKIESDGPLSMSFNYESLKDNTIGSNIKVIVTTTDPTIA